MAWVATTPVSGSKVLATPTIFQGNWVEMENIIGVEHYGMDNSLSGRHKPGLVGAMYVGNNATIAGLSSPTTGAMAWLSESGSAMGLIRGTTAWKRVHYDLPATRVIVVGPTSSTVTCGIYGLFMSGSTETVDTLGEWNTTTGVFSGCDAGYFLFTATAALSTTLTGADTVTMGFCGSNILESSTFTTDPSAYCTQIFSTMISAASAVKVAPYVICGTQNISLSGGAGVTHCEIYRIS